MIQRVVHNEAQWMKPSIGRLNTKKDKGFIVEHGFGHEDWNFSGDLAKDKFVHGYAYQEPRDSSGYFTIVFATYASGIGWSVRGYYDNVTFDPDGAEFSDSILSRRADELIDLRSYNSLGGKYRRCSKNKIISMLKDEQIIYRLKAEKNDVHFLQIPVDLPKEFTDRLSTTKKRFGSYFTTMTEISEVEWKFIKGRISKFVDKNPLDDFNEGGDVEFPEGERVQKLHFQRERNVALVRKAKADFLRKHNRLYCEICNFDFKQAYGAIGDGFIEAHHIIPISESPPERQSVVSDLALVCSNCHRMLHRKRPWPGNILELRSIVKANRKKQ